MPRRPRLHWARSAPVLLLPLALLFFVPALAEYLGPDRRVQDLVQVRDPSNDVWVCIKNNPPPGWLGTCILQNPNNPCRDAGGSHPSVGQQLYWCGWIADTCGCDPAYTYTAIEYDLPEATTSTDLLNCTLSNGWCGSPSELRILGAEPLAGYAILAIEGTRNGEAFACSDPLCDVPLLEGDNAFSFWAISSYGDSSRMGEMAARQDSVGPTTQFTGPPEGTEPWASGEIRLTGSSLDAVSGVAEAWISTNGGIAWTPLAPALDGSWVYQWTSTSTSDGPVWVLARARDAAGNLGDAAQVRLLIDNSPPHVELPERWMIWDPVPLVAEDGGGGMARIRLTIEAGALGRRRLDFSPGTLPDEFVWDRRIGDYLAPIGDYPVTLEAWDILGNSSADSGTLVIPEPQAMPPDSGSPSAPPAPDEPIPSEPKAESPLKPAQGDVAPPVIPPAQRASPSLPSSIQPAFASTPAWGSAALALAAAATAYALHEGERRRQAHEAELAAKRAQAAAWAAEAQARRQRVLINAEASRQYAAARQNALAAAAAAEAQQARMARLHQREQEQQAREEQAEARAREAARARAAQAQQAALRRAERMERTAAARDEPAPSAPALMTVPSFWSNPLGWAQASIINAGRRDEATRQVLTQTLAPAADSLRSMADPERNPRVAAFHEGFWSGVRAWGDVAAMWSATIDYTRHSLEERRWSDAARGADGLRQEAGVLARAGLQAVGQAVWGVVTTPVRIITTDIPEFAAAIRERGQGRDRAWDVVFTGAMLEADLAGTYALGRPWGLWNRVNASLARRVPFLRLPTALDMHYGGSLRPSARTSFSGWQAIRARFGEGTRLYRLHSALEEGGNPYGRWWSTRVPASELQWRLDLAVDPELMGNSGAAMSELTVPPGESLAGWTGGAGYIRGFYVGGGGQVFLERVPPTWVTTQPSPWLRGIPPVGH